MEVFKILIQTGHEYELCKRALKYANANMLTGRFIRTRAVHTKNASNNSRTQKHVKKTTTVLMLT